MTRQRKSRQRTFPTFEPLSTSYMSTPPKVKNCGHEGCLLVTTKTCCGCEDRRPIRAFYTYYQDGKGVIKDSSEYARFWGYCPTCKYQLTRLREGRKRCACGLVRCDLTTEKCCICTDKRPKGQLSYKYVDGKGLIPLKGATWIHYCPACQKRSKPPEPEEPSVSSPENNKKAPNFSEGPYSSRDSLTTEMTTASNSPTTVSIISGSNPTTTFESPQLKKEDNAAGYDDFADYELIDSSDVVCDKLLPEKSVARKKARRSWWDFVRLHQGG